MPRYVAVIPSRWPAAKALAYMADFSNAAEWDPGVAAATRDGADPVAVGSAFDLKIRMGKKRTMPLRYAITNLGHDSVTLIARTARLESIDTITVTTVGETCSVRYDAFLTFLGLAKAANPILALTFKKMGDRAKASLVTHLNS